MGVLTHPFEEGGVCTPQESIVQASWSLQYSAISAAVQHDCPLPSHTPHQSVYAQYTSSDVVILMSELVVWRSQ
jgi:hypothetical protein